ncbi:MAG: HAD-IB family phosphatase [Bdellovibrionales bacterium]|nr:HAD-IB family phosphatase [Bdellovibrionales bacterium]
MESHPFQASLLDQFKNQITNFMEKNTGPYYAAFDADGTLWNNDLGEQFFQYEIDHCHLESLKNVDPWHYYESTKAVDPVKAYLWLAQINKGQPINNVKTWAAEAVERGGAKVFQSQKDWISWLKDQGITVYIVTASVQWAVEPAAQMVGVDSQHVLGIRTKIDDQGIVGDEQDGWITWREGKAQTLLKHTNGVAPIFCAGNTYGDISLLESSACARLAVQTQTIENGLFEEESRLLKHALEMGWPTHHFFKT